MINIAVIGIGRMGSIHARNIARKFVRGAKLIAVCDLDSLKLEKFKKEYKKIKTFKNYKDLLSLKELDAVIIATEHYFHSELAMFFLNNKIHVLLEKPITVTTLEAKKIIKTSNDNPEIYFGLVYIQRTNKMYIKAKRLIDSGKLGKIQRANYIITNWYRSQSYYDHGDWRATWSGEGGGMLLNQCVHQLDIIQWLLGVPKSISSTCQTINRSIKTENDVSATFYYDDFKLSFTGSTHELPGTNRFEIVGDKGTIIIDNSKGKVYLLKQSEKEVNKLIVQTSFGVYGTTAIKRYTIRYGLIRRIIDEIFGQQLRVVKAFINAIQNKDSNLLIAKGTEGINALSMINAIYLSNWKKEVIALPIDDLEYNIELQKRIKDERSVKNVKS